MVLETRVNVCMFLRMSFLGGESEFYKFKARYCDLTVIETSVRSMYLCYQHGR